MWSEARTSRGFAEHVQTPHSRGSEQAKVGLQREAPTRLQVRKGPDRMRTNGPTGGLSYVAEQSSQC